MFQLFSMNRGKETHGDFREIELLGLDLSKM